ncbi:response regulator [Vibrio rotiferianus]|uniref:response regulator n=1 Tax=Vibrio rotiferianus TaxID=190895 RepID=UPI00390B9B51
MDILAQSRYLIIDDSSVIQSATRALLIKLGVPNNNVISAANAQNAIAACRSHRFDILLIDHDLGAGSNGLQLLEFLRQKELIKASTLVFVVTGNDTQDIFFGYSHFEPDGYLIKPIRADDIIKRVSLALSRQQFFATLEQTYLKQDLNAVKPLFAQAPDPATLKDAIIYMSNVLIKHQQLDQAHAMLNGLLQLHDYLPAKIKVIEVYFAQKRYEEALNSIEALIDANPRNIKLLQLKVKICLCANKMEEAQKLINQVLSVNSTNIEMTTTMVWLQLFNRNTAEANIHLRSLARLMPYSIWDSAGKRALILWSDYQSLTGKELAMWRPDSAWQRLTNVEKALPLTKPMQNLCRSLQLLQLNQPETAKELIWSLSHSDFLDSDIEAHFLLAMCYQAIGMQEELEQVRIQTKSYLNNDDSGLALLQRLTFEQLDNFDLPPLIETSQVAVG